LFRTGTLDHSADLNVMTEAMTDGGFKNAVSSSRPGTDEKDSILHSYSEKAS